MTMPRLSPQAPLPDAVARPRYDRGALTPGILHIGLGAFHRAHQAVYTDAALAQDFAGWGIESVSLRSVETARALNGQDGLYSVIVRDGDTTRIGVVGSILKAHAARENPQLVLDRLADPAIRIVTLTVTEKAYGLDPKTGGLDRTHPDVAHDLANPDRPRGVIGHLAAGLARRKAAGIEAFTVLCCDNLPSNGHIVERLVGEFAGACDRALAEWIATTVAFPSSMVDRIVPASTSQTCEDAQALLGCRDEAAVETEPFIQWVIEDRFPSGRPAWEAGGAIVVADVEPYEKMKLRLLNGAHSLIAYLGRNRELAYVRDVMAVAEWRELVKTHMREAALTLPPVRGIDLEAYTVSLIERFSNRAIAHATRQIAMDGTQKLPQRLLQPALEALQAGHGIDTYARAVAEWIVFCCRADAIDDPRQEELLAARAKARGNGGKLDPEPFLSLPGLFPEPLRSGTVWHMALRAQLDLIG